MRTHIFIDVIFLTKLYIYVIEKKKENKENEKYVTCAVLLGMINNNASTYR